MESYEKYVIDLIRSVKLQIVLIICLFTAGIIISFTDTLSLNEFIYLIIKHLMNTFKQYRGIELFFMIFFNNSKVSAIMLFGGIFLAIIPIIGAVINGMILGFVFKFPQLMGDKSGYIIFMQLVPHGIFELPGFIIALALGVKLGNWLFKKEKTERLKTNIKAFFFYYIKVILPLLLIAAFIETIGIETMFFINGK